MSWLENREHRVAKKRVVAEASRLDVSAAQIARRYDLNANLLFNWRKKYGAEGALVAVEILPDDGLGHSNYVPEELDNGGSAASGSGPTHVLEIDLPCGSRLRCGREIRCRGGRWKWGGRAQPTSLKTNYLNVCGCSVAFIFYSVLPLQ